MTTYRSMEEVALDVAGAVSEHEHMILTSLSKREYLARRKATALRNALPVAKPPLHDKIVQQLAALDDIARRCDEAYRALSEAIYGPTEENNDA